MDVRGLINHLAAEGPLLATAAEHAGWDAPVPATQWDVRQLVTHVGGVHRWATTVVADGPAEQVHAAATSVGTGPPDEELLDWFVDGHAALVTALGDAPRDLAASTFLPADSPLHFWARRQAHETAIHRADAEAAAGQVTPFDTDFAQDGIAEILQGFAARRKNAIERQATMALSPSDEGVAWKLVFGGERIAVEPTAAAAAEVTLAGSSSELYLWLWNRPSSARITGDGEIAALWTKTVRVGWG